MRRSVPSVPATRAGLAAALLGAGTRAAAQLVLFDQTSEPGAIVEQWAYVESATNVSTVFAYPVCWDYRFTHWTLNGERSADPLDRALNPVAFRIYETTRAVAHYLPADADQDADGVPDWFELQLLGRTNSAARSDADADGFDLAAEYRADTHPGIRDSIAPGGVSRQRSAPTLVIVSSDAHEYRERSMPAWVLDRSRAVRHGADAVSSRDYEEPADQSFALWMVGGARQADAFGRALDPIRVTVAADTEAVVVYLPDSYDSDADGVPDWYEWRLFGATANAGDSDTDGDGFGLAAEYRLDLQADIKDSPIPGGISRRRSDGLLTVNLTGLPEYTVRADAPVEGIDTSGVVPHGGTVNTPCLGGASNGFVFAEWTVNRMRQQDQWGFALPALSLIVTSATLAVAHYCAPQDDSDGDALPDWFEWRHFGNLAHVAGEDSDGDGFNLAQEVAHDDSPLIPDAIASGGVSRRRSGLTVVNMQSFEPVESILVDGAYSAFFARWPTNETGLPFGGATAPAFGDWDGDRDLDLFVGAGRGALRVFENVGSRTLVNLSEVAYTNLMLSFPPWAAAWFRVAAPAPALSDWDRDGDADLAIGGGTGAVLLVTSPGTFALPPALSVYALPVGGPSALPTFADADSDGFPDLLVLGSNGTVRVYLNTREATRPFRAPASIENLLGTNVPFATGIAGGDVNADGRDDVLVSDASGRIWEFDGHTNGVYRLKTRMFGGAHRGFGARLTVTLGDIDGDGDSDLATGSAAGRLTCLRNEDPRLVVLPPRATLISGETTLFSVLNSARTVVWSLVLDNSGASLDPVSGRYVAGPSAGGVDVVEAADDTGKTGRGYVNVISRADAAGAGKAIILGGRKGPFDPLWPTTDFLGASMYNVLRYRAFTKENIFYLNPETDRDADGDGQTDDVDARSTWTNAAFAVRTWARDAERLVLYLVDHGAQSSGDGHFRIGPSEVLPAAQLDAWLDELQDARNIDVVVLLDFCYSGSFVPALTYGGRAKRIVIASCAADEPTYFMAGGLVSFSDALMNGILLGLDLQRGFEFGRDTMALYQTAQTGGSNARGVYLGPSFLAGSDIPAIGRVSGNQVLHKATQATLWAADVASACPIERVWCMVVPPGHTPDLRHPVTDVPELTLAYNGDSSRYEAAYEGFSEDGIYKIAFYAQDIFGAVSFPRNAYVTQSGFDERVLLVNAVDPHSPKWADVNGIAVRACRTFLARRLDSASIQFLTSAAWEDVDDDGINDVDGPPTRANVAGAVTNWADPADRLTVFLIGEGESGRLKTPADGGALRAAELDAWLDRFQARDRAVNVILEFSGSGAFVPDLTPPPGMERICAASGGAGKSCLWASRGRLSFSAALLSHVFNGASLGAAFEEARGIMHQASGRLRQTAELDDNGDGVANRGSDGALARTRYLGAAFVTGGDSPLINTVMPETVSTSSGATVSLWISDVTDMDGVSNVWCVVTPPDCTETDELETVELRWNQARNRFEAERRFTGSGTHVLTFFAEDPSGEMSVPVQSAVLVADANADSDGDGLPDGWEYLFFGNITNASAHADPDADGHDNGQEWLAQTDPRDPRSILRLDGSTASGARQFILAWTAVPARRYTVERSTNLCAGFEALASDLTSPGGAMGYTDGVETVPCSFYRLCVECDGSTAKVFSANAVGRVRVHCPSGRWVLSGLNVDPGGHDSIDAVFTGQLQGGRNPASADQVITYDAASGGYRYYWKFDSGTGHRWDGRMIDRRTSALATNAFLAPGDGFWLLNQSGTDETVTFAGDLAQEPAATCVLREGFTLMAFPFACVVPLTNSSLRVCGARGGRNPASADQVIFWDAETQNYRHQWLFDSQTGHAFDGTWIDRKFNRPSGARFEPGTGAWYQRAATNDLHWAQPRPY